MFDYICDNGHTFECAESDYHKYHRCIYCRAEIYRAEPCAVCGKLIAGGSLCEKCKSDTKDAFAAFLMELKPEQVEFLQEEQDGLEWSAIRPDFTRGNSPCYDCKSREIGCHGKCDRYKVFRDEYASIRAKRAEDTAIRQYDKDKHHQLVTRLAPSQRRWIK